MDQTPEADYWIDRLGLVPHPEGGYYDETYESDDVVVGDGGRETDRDGRATASSIYYLLKADSFSAFHRMDADELWHFYRGDPVRLYLLDDGLETVVVGRDRFQTVVPGGTWFAAEVASDLAPEPAHGYALVGCDVTPAFDDAGYELADEGLADEYEDHRELVERLVRWPPLTDGNADREGER